MVWIGSLGLGNAVETPVRGIDSWPCCMLQLLVFDGPRDEDFAGSSLLPSTMAIASIHPVVRITPNVFVLLFNLSPSGGN